MAHTEETAPWVLCPFRAEMTQSSLGLSLNDSGNVLLHVVRRVQVTFSGCLQTPKKVWLQWLLLQCE